MSAVMPMPQVDDIYYTFVEQVDVSKVNLMINQIQQFVLPRKPKRLHLMLSSPGGDVSAGIALYNYLRAIPVEILTYNIGMVASIANVIFMAADAKNRFACPYTSFLFHGVKLNLLAPMQVDYAQMKEFESNMSRDLERISEVFLAHTSLKKEKIDALFKQGEIQNLEGAVTDGIIAEVKMLKIPAEALQFAFALNLSYMRPN